MVIFGSEAKLEKLRIEWGDVLRKLSCGEISSDDAGVEIEKISQQANDEGYSHLLNISLMKASITSLCPK